MLIEIIKPDFQFEDDRGKLCQLVHEGWKQINVIVSKKDQIRGKHYHKNNSEAFYIINGLLELHLKYNDIQEKYIFKSGDMFVIRPNILHTFVFIEDCILVSMYNNGVEEENSNKDIYTEDK